MPAECAVSSLPSDTTLPSIEVSGWDAEGRFFVEIARLELTDEGEISTHLYHRMISGSLVFVRLAGTVADSDDKDYPAAHEAQQTEMPDRMGRCRVHLIRCQRPRPANTRDQGGTTRI
jgi:hypothetical protein